MKLQLPFRRRRRGANITTRRGKLAALAVALVFIAGSLVYAFGKQSLFSGGYQVKAMFRDASQLRKGSEIRISGLAIGRVTGVQANPAGTALVTMKIKSGQPPIRVQDRMTIKPRLAFEGNFYVDVATGNPNAPQLKAGDVVPAKLTSSSVQLDQVLTTFDRPTRDSAKTFVGTLASGLGVGSAPTGLGTTGARGLRRTARELDRTLVAVGRTSKAFRGTEPGDLKRALDSTGELTTTLAKNPGALQDIITNYGRVIGRLAASDRDLSQTIASADGFLRAAPPSLTRIDAMLPLLRTFSTAIRPALRELPQRLRPINSAFAQVATVALPSQLPTLVRNLESPVRTLPQVVNAQLPAILPYAKQLGQCLSNTVVPTLEKRVPDGRLTVKQPAWLELLHAFSNFNSGSEGFDGNGSTLRVGLTEGETSFLGSVPGLGKAVNVLGGGDVEGASPQWLGQGRRPLKRVDQPCEDQALPNLESGTHTNPFEGSPNANPSARTKERRIDANAAALRAAHADLTKRFGKPKANDPVMQSRRAAQRLGSPAVKRKANER